MNPDAASVVTASAGTGSPKVYNIGPGQLYPTIESLNWNNVGPGDTVNIYYQPGGYHELFQISTRGTPNAWITINGVPDPTTGALPYISGLNAVLAPQFENHYAPDDGAGDVIIGDRPGQNTGGYKPGYILIQNLQFQDCWEGTAPMPLRTITAHKRPTEPWRGDLYRARRQHHHQELRG